MFISEKHMLESGEVSVILGADSRWQAVSTDEVSRHKLNFCCDVGFPNQAALACEMHSHSKGIFFKANTSAITIISPKLDAATHADMWQLPQTKASHFPRQSFSPKSPHGYRMACEGQLHQ